MKERTGRNRVSKADQAARKIGKEEPVQSSRSRISKADQVSRKIGGEEPVQSSRSRVSKVDRISQKIGEEQTVQSSRSRVSKADQISRKIDSPVSQPSDVSARVRPSSKVEEIQRKIPVNPAQTAERPSRPDVPQPSARVTPPSPKPEMSRGRSGGCCLLPFTLAALVVIGSFLIIF